MENLNSSLDLSNKYKVNQSQLDMHMNSNNDHINIKAISRVR